MRPALITISTVLLGGVLAHFSEDFSKFLDEKYGEEVRNALEGNHLKNVSEMLSFGGKVFANEVITKTPVIFVHGVAATANVFAKHREYFIQHGYSPAELYATTYGDGGLTRPFDVPILCKYIQQVPFHWPNFLKR
ncbi:unnamed protein product [Toxocara canis]|uniref:Abhydro_lipase domain-containing protein n=1 Tax=Toxocara canis TaxID=6265 RepID=A0A183U7F8_TOXCA|nr:unnamed protein product [Toxocara canis]